MHHSIFSILADLLFFLNKTEDEYYYYNSVHMLGEWGNLVNLVKILEIGQERRPFYRWKTGGGLIFCSSLKIESRNIYLYSFKQHSPFKICQPNKNYKNDFEMIKSLMPFYIDWFNYQNLNFEILGSYYNFTFDDIQNKMLRLSIGSTVIVAAAVDHQGIRKVSEELIYARHNVFPYESNPYFRFLKYLINNPDSNYIFIKQNLGVSFFYLT